MIDKETLRRHARAIRSERTDAQRQAAVTAIIPQVLALPELSAGPIMLYVSIRRELPTERLFEALWDAGHTVAVPHIEAGGRMSARRRMPDSPLHLGAHGVPTTHDERLSPTLAICPGLAFDQQGWRLGYGGGYYDRWLTETGAIAVGICTAEAIVPHVPHDAFDRPMQIIVHPEQTHRPQG